MQADAQNRPRRLPNAQRRQQLLDTAMEVIREQGADALTLGHLAERAGVSKPVVYDHFGTRSGLLIALYRQIDGLQVQALVEALATAPRQLSEVAWLISTSYMTCHRLAGPEGHAVFAALAGDPQMGAVQQELVDGCVAIFRDALAPFSSLPSEDLYQRCVGIVGAAEALSRSMTGGGMDEAAAIANLMALMRHGIDARET